MKKKLVAILVGFVMLLGLCIIVVPQMTENVYAAQSSNSETTSSEMSEEQIQEILENKITGIEEKLAIHNTDVITELINQKLYYENMLATTTSENYEKIQNLIDVTQILIEEYQMYKIGSTYGVQSFCGQTMSFVNPTVGVPLPDLKTDILFSAVSAIAAGFFFDELYLASELLTHSLVNRSEDSYYYPLNGGQVLLTSHFTNKVSLAKYYNVPTDYLLGLINEY